MAVKRHNRDIEGIVNEVGVRTSAHWAKELHTLPDDQIGVIKASGKVVSPSYAGMRGGFGGLERFSAETAFLNKYGFRIPIVTGGGVIYDELPSYQNNKSKVNGLRVTSKQLIDDMVPVAQEHQQLVVETLIKYGVDAVAIDSHDIVMRPHGPERNELGDLVDMGFVGDVEYINTKEIRRAIANGQWPVINHIGYDVQGQAHNGNATVVAAELLKYMRAKKLVLIGDTPVKEEGKVITDINSQLDWDFLVRTGIVDGGMITNGYTGFDAIKTLGPGHYVHIISLEQEEDSGKVTSVGLAKELLGDGSGTQISIPPLMSSYSMETVDCDLVYDIMEEVFSEKGKHVVGTYFDGLESRDPTIYLDAMHEEPHGGAVGYDLGGEFEGVEYLCKIFTHKDYEGLGIARAAITAAVKSTGSIAFRVCKDNKDAVCAYERIIEHMPSSDSVDCGDYRVMSVGVDPEMRSSLYQNVAAMEKTVVSPN